MAEENALKNIELKEGFVLVSVNPKLYPLSVIYAAAYALLDRVHVIIDGDPETEILVELRAKSKDDDLKEIAYCFNDELINYSVYTIQTARNKGLREAILQSALIANNSDYFVVPQEQVKDEPIKGPEEIMKLWEEPSKEEAEGLKAREEVADCAIPIETDCAIQIEIKKCKNACIFCRPKGFKDFEKADIREVTISIYEQALNLRKRGFSNVEISGHDPIQFEKIIGYIKWLKHIGFKTVTLATHGRDFCDMELVKKFKSVGLDAVRIALYGSNPKIHDSVTQSLGSFDETIQGLKNIKKCASQIKVELHTLFMRENIGDVMEILSLFSEFDGSFIRICMPFISEPMFKKNSAVSFSEIKSQIKQIFDVCKKKFCKDFFFVGIPYCIFGFYDARIVGGGIPALAENYSVPEIHKTEEHGVPKYRLKQKLKICKGCKYDAGCSGFIKDYVDYFDMDNDINLRPIPP